MQMTNSRKAIAAEIRAWLGRRGLSQGALAAMIGMRAQTFSARMTCKQPFDLEELQAIAEALGIDLLDLIGVTAA